MPPDDASAGRGARRNGAATRRQDHAAMSRSAPPPVLSPGMDPIELRLVVWIDPGSVWRARVSGVGIAEREFVSPFELARFVAWPLTPTQRGDSGLR
jgi:hypothetical protein